MPTCMIDGKKIEFEAGENLVDVAKRGGIEIPVFCYHPRMTVVAQCRMCTIEIKGAPKLATACSTEAKDGMEVFTKSEKAKKQQEAVMEFLLVNHPLDCPICDKSGECDLQDFSYLHGNSYMRTVEDRRTYLDLDMGPVIQKNMNRCIHCTRCIRFGDEIAGIREMVAVQRGNSTEITTLDGRSLETDYAGNYADICPTGSLTLKDFRFNKRAWMLKKTPTICEGCSRGCNMEVHWDANVIHRCLPRENDQINKSWLCDEGRFNFHYLHDPNRIREPMVRSGNQLQKTSWASATKALQKFSGEKKLTVLVGTDLTQEEATLVQDFVKNSLKNASVFHFGTPGVEQTSKDADADRILKRKSKTANLHGVEKLGLKPLGSKSFQKTDFVIVFRGGRAVLPKLGEATVAGIGVFMKTDAEEFEAVLPGFAFAEKDGTVFNCDGIEQKYQVSIRPPRMAKSVSEIVSLWSSSGLSLGSGAA